MVGWMDGGLLEMGRSRDNVDDHLLRELDVLLRCKGREKRKRKESAKFRRREDGEKKDVNEHPVISIMESPSRGMKISAPDSALSRETVAPLVPTILAKEDWGRPAMIPMNAFSSADLIASSTVLIALSRACWFLDLSVHSTVSSPCPAYRGKISKR